MLVILSIKSSLGYPEEGFVFILAILSIISPGYPRGKMMDTITNMNTNPSSGYPKEEMMDNLVNINTNPSSVYP
jgi:hypothetical protein